MYLSKKTKIIATIGPSSQSEKVISSLIKDGVNIFRFNTKHNVNDWHVENIKKVHKVAKELAMHVGVLVDLQGPEIRIETFNGEELEVKQGQLVVFAGKFDVHVDKTLITGVIRIAQPEVFEALSDGDEFSIDDGFIDFKVLKVHEGYFIAEAKEDAVIKNRKGLNLVGIDVKLPSLTKPDIERIAIMSHVHVDFIALSFVRTAEDVNFLRHEMEKNNLHSKIVAKIESQKGVDNIDEILEASDAVMIARGDLGIEVPIERMTHLQKTLINKCREKNKPVIVATQMLQSMVDNARPTRAEAADVSNAVYDETDCIMLSNETAAGKYPVKAVETMRKIATYNEHHKNPNAFKPHLTSQTHLIVNAALSIVEGDGSHNGLKVDKIVVLTETGSTARVFSSFRPRIPVIAISESERTVTELAINYGVQGVKLNIEKADLIYPTNLIKQLEEQQLVTSGETLLIVHGHKYKEPGSTNAMVIVKVS